MKRIEDVRGFSLKKLSDALEIACETGNEGEMIDLALTQQSLENATHIDDVLSILDDMPSSMFNLM